MSKTLLLAILFSCAGLLAEEPRSPLILAQGWEVAYGAAADARPTAWSDLAASRTREGKLAAPRQPNLPLQVRVVVPTTAGSGPWVLAVGNRRTFERAWVDDVALTDISTRPVVETEMKEVAAKLWTPGSMPKYTLATKYGRAVWEWWRADGEGRWRIPAGALKPGSVLRLAGFDLDWNDGLLGRVELRQPQLDDALVPYLWTRPTGAWSNEGVITLSQLIPLSGPITVDIEAQDWFGAQLWREQRSVAAAVAATHHTLFVTARGRTEHRALVTISQGGRSLPVQTLYFALPDRERGTHRQLLLPEFAWQQRDLPQGELGANGQAVLPPPADGWRPGQIFVTRDNGVRATHRGYLRQTFRLPADAVGRANLRIDELSYRAEVVLNGTRLGVAEWHRLPARFDMTAALRRDGDNELVLVWQDWTAYIRPGIAVPVDGVGEPPRGSMLAGFQPHRVNLGVGATAIELVPDLHISSLKADPDHQAQELRVTATIRNASTAAATATLAATVADRSARPAAVTLAPSSEQEVTLRIPTSGLGRWSPWTPTLHPLVATLTTAGGTVADVRQDRLGLRHLAIAGDQLVLDGRPLHLFGAVPPIPTWMEWTVGASGYAAYLREMRAAGFTNQRNGGEGGQATQLVFEIADEIGMLSRIPSAMDDMQRGYIAYSDSQMHENHQLQLQHRGRELWNHPSFVFYDNGNEVLYPTTGVAELPAFMFRTEERLRASDPHRLVLHNGSYHKDFPASIHTPHYYKDRALKDNTHNWLRADPAIAERMPDAVLARHDIALQVPRTRPVFCGEFIWQVNEQELSQGVQSVGELVCKPFGWWKDATHSLGASYLLWESSRITFARYRASGMVGGDLLWWPLNSLPEGNTEPVLAEFLDTHTRAFGGTPLERWLLVANDDGTERKVDVILRADGREVVRRSFTLAHGASERPVLDLPLPQVAKPTQIALVLEAQVAGQRRTLRRQTATVFPRSELAIPAPAAVLDPQGSLRGVIAGAKVRSVASVAEVGESLLILGEDLGAERIAELAPSLRTFVEKGGNVLVCRQAGGVAGLFDLAGTVKRAPVGRSLLLAPGHPALTGLLPDDLADWAPDDLVTSVAYDLVPNGTGRVLAGMGKWGTHLYEGRLGRGRFALCTFELTTRALAAEPAAGILLQNLLTWLAAPATATPASTVVWSPTAGPTTRALRDELGLQARFGTASEAIGDATTLILADWQDSSPDATQAAAAKSLLQRGGTLLVYRSGPPLDAWLQQVSGGPWVRSQAIAKRLVKTAVHPLLWGMADTDLGYGDGSWREQPPLRKESTQDAVRDLVLPRSAQALTFPAALAVLQVGTGRVVVDQSRWVEVDAGRSPHRIQQALLTNLGATLVPPPPPQTPLLTGLNFTPVDLAAVANQTRADAQKFDGIGFIDWGTELKLAPGRQRFGGVEFLIPPEPAGARTLIGLRAGKDILSAAPPVMLTELPEATAPIAVGQKASAVFALHTCAYPLEPVGTPLWEYEVRYEGYGKLVPGADYEPYRIIVPVRAGVDVGDWTYGAKKPPLPGVAIGPADAPQWLYVQRIDNPKPTRVIESIVVRSLAVRGAPVVVALSLGSAAANLVAGDFAQVPPFRVVVNAGKSAADGNRWSSSGWAGNCWSNDTTGVIGLLAASGSEPARLVLTNSGGKASAQLYSDWFERPAGTSMTVSLLYRTLGEARLAMDLKPKTGVLKRVDQDPSEGEREYILPASSEWRRFTCRVRVGEAQSANPRILFQNRGLGTAEVREVWVTAE